MKLSEVTKDSLKELSNITLTNLHFKIHQIWACRRKKKVDIELLKNSHELVRGEMEERNLKHNPNFLRQNLSKLFMYNEDLE